MLYALEIPPEGEGEMWTLLMRTWGVGTQLSLFFVHVLKIFIINPSGIK